MTVKYQPKLHIVLFCPEIPQNTGAIGRTCVALQAKLWLVRPLGFQLNEKTLRRAGLDYWQHLEWQITDHWEELDNELEGVRKWFFSRFAKKPFRTVQYQAGDALVFGSETSGLPKKMTTGVPDQLLRIPTRPEVRSLNLASSVAVAGYECQRQIESEYDFQ
ncbi:MAG: tRNA (cytidine(34)-2'-O)-methyltransferase [Planctomycetota bacterium]